MQPLKLRKDWESLRETVIFGGNETKNNGNITKYGNWIWMVVKNIGKKLCENTMLHYSFVSKKSCPVHDFLYHVYVGFALSCHHVSSIRWLNLNSLHTWVDREIRVSQIQWKCLNFYIYIEVGEDLGLFFTFYMMHSWRQTKTKIFKHVWKNRNLNNNKK